MNKHAITAIALLFLIGTARAIDGPSLKEGFWSVHQVTTDNPGNKVTDGHYSICRNHAFDHHLDNAPKNPNCNFTTDTMLGNKHITSGTCHTQSTTITTKSTGTYLGDTAVHVENISTYSPALLGHTTETMVIDFKYTGACPAGIHPGDRVASDGTVLHLWKQ
jgi:hypothetical protein